MAIWARKLVAGRPGRVFYEYSSNLISTPKTFDSWTPNNSVVTANNIVDPEGALTADTITDIASGTTTAVTLITAPVTFNFSKLYRYSVYIKAGTVPWVRLGIINMPPLSIQVYFNVLTGAIGTIAVNVIAAGVDDPINGWRRYWITFTSDAIDNLANPQITLCSADNVNSVFRDGTNTMYLWLAQLALV